MPTIRELAQSGQLEQLPIEQLQQMLQQAESGQPVNVPLPEQAPQAPKRTLGGRIMTGLGAAGKQILTDLPSVLTEGKLPTEDDGEFEKFKRREIFKKGLEEPKEDPVLKKQTKRIADLQDFAAKKGGQIQIDNTLPMEEQVASARRQAAEIVKKQQGLPEGYKESLKNAISAIDNGMNPIEVFRKISAAFPARSSELKRILLAGEEEDIEEILFGR